MLLQEHYVEKLLKKFGHYDVTPSTPCNAITQLRKNIGYLVDQFKYFFSRPNIAYVVCRLSSYTQYLRGTMSYAIRYSGFSDVLEG